MTDWIRDTSGFDAILADYQIAEALKAYEKYGNGKYESLLDVACSNGFLTQYYLPRFRTVHGVDANRNLIKHARKRRLNARFYVSLIEQFQPEKQYDFITCINLLEHLESMLPLRKLQELLNETGIIHVQVPNARSLNRRIGVEMGLLPNSYEVTAKGKTVGHKKMYDLEMLEETAIQEGFRILDSGGFFLKPFANDQMQFFLNTCFGSDQSWRRKLCNALYKVGETMQDLCGLLYVTLGKD